MAVILERKDSDWDEEWNVRNNKFDKARTKSKGKDLQLHKLGNTSEVGRDDD